MRTSPKRPASPPPAGPESPVEHGPSEAPAEHEPSGPAAEHEPSGPAAGHEAPAATVTGEARPPAATGRSPHRPLVEPIAVQPRTAGPPRPDR